MSIPPGAWLARPLGLHLAAALVLALAMVAGFFGVLVAVEAFDPNGLLQSDSEELSTEPVTTAGYLGELAFAAVPALLVCSLLLPVLRAAGSPAPRLAAAAMAVLPLAAFALLIVDSRIEERAPGGCCAGPGLAEIWWDVWIATGAAVLVASLVASCWAMRTGRSCR